MALGKSWWHRVGCALDFWRRILVARTQTLLATPVRQVVVLSVLCLPQGDDHRWRKSRVALLQACRGAQRRRDAARSKPVSQPHSRTKPRSRSSIARTFRRHTIHACTHITPTPHDLERSSNFWLIIGALRSGHQHCAAVTSIAQKHNTSRRTGEFHTLRFGPPQRRPGC